MKIKIPATTVEACDLCKHPSSSSLLSKCLVCGRDYCHTCEAIMCGCIHQPDLCKECAKIEKVEIAVETYAPLLQDVIKRRAGVLRRIGKSLPLLLACLSLALVQRKGAQILVDLADGRWVKRASDGRNAALPASTISNLYSSDFARSFILRTNYPAPSPVAGPQELPTVKAVAISRAVATPSTNGPIVLPQFLYTNIPPNWWWHRLEADTPNGPWRTNDRNMRMPPSGTVRLVRTNKAGYWQMMGTPNQIP